jgi:Fe-S oxidoreductase
MGNIAGLSLALLLATGMSAVVTTALPVNLQDSIRSLYYTLLSTMKDGRRLGQSGRYAGLAPAEYIVSADSSCLMHQRGCAERIGVPLKFIHIAQILNGASA